MKACATCKETKPLADFCKSSRAADGLDASCRACAKARNRARYTANKEKILAVHSTWKANNRDKVNASARRVKAAHAEEYNANTQRWRDENPDKIKAYAKRYYAENVEKIKARQRRHAVENHELLRVKRRKNKYGVTPEAQALMNTGKCEICLKPESDAPRGRLCLDHDHTTGDARGFLCGHCNTGLGLFRDRPDLLARAIAYLSKINVFA